MTPSSPVTASSRNSLARAVTLLVAATFFIEMFDGTVIATALPQIARSFGMTAVAANLGMTSYLLATAAFIPIGGWIADRIGFRATFIGAIAVFTAASWLCGCSGTMWSFVGARALQGSGGAAMVPVGRAIVLKLTGKGQLVSAIGTIVWPGLIAPVIAPAVGGFLVTHASWRWIFFLNIPLGLMAITAALFIVPGDERAASRRPFDFLGFMLAVSAVTLATYALDGFANGYLRVGVAFLLISAAGVFATLAAFHLRRTRVPFINLEPLAIRTFAAVAGGGSLIRISIGALPFLMPLTFQVGFGLDAQASGYLILPVFLGNIAMKLFTTGLIGRFGFRNTLLVSGGLAASSIAACGFLTHQTPWWVIVTILFLGGAFRSVQFTSLATIQFSDIAHDRLPDANTLGAVFQQLTLGVGVAISVGLLTASAWYHSNHSHDPSIADFHAAFFGLGALALLGLIDIARLDCTAGSAIATRRTSGG